MMEDLKKTYVMKGVGAPEYYLGGDVVQLDEQWHREGIYTAFSAETYIRNSLDRLAKMVGIEEFPKQKTPMNSEYHPELDNTPLCCTEVISKYRSLIGRANWIIILGHF